MRITIAITLGALMVALAACVVLARRSTKSIAPYVVRLLLCLMPPMLGNLIIIASNVEMVATIGAYMYYIGMDFTMFALFCYVVEYCRVEFRHPFALRAVHLVISFDIVQLALNPLLGHAFDLRLVQVDGASYYSLVPFAFQNFHRVVDYGLFVYSLGVFFHRSLTAPRIYRERYVVILITMVLVGGWQTFYVLSGTPIDRSMMGYGVFGVLVYYFSLVYRPMRLLDRLLSGIVSSMEDALFFFDREGDCIYANETGQAFVGLDEYHMEKAPVIIEERLGSIPFEETGDWSVQRSTGESHDARYYQVGFRAVKDDQQKQVGSYLSIHDRTNEELAQREESYYARHDHLTGLYNKEYLYAQARELMDANPQREFVVAALDVRDFKIVNDIFGTEFGDLALTTISRKLQGLSMRDSLFGRLSGDKFGFVAFASEFRPDIVNRELSHVVVSDGRRSHAILLHLGVYEVRERGIDVSVMFDRAFMAIASIKNDYQVHLAYYDDAMRQDVLWSQRISAELPGAIRERQVVPYLQPIVDGSGKPVGAEALVRWNHPTEGFLPPYRFIPIFEKNGMIAELDVYMWRCACELLRKWQSMGIDLFISVNISPKDFYFMDVFEVIRDLASEYRIDPGKLRLEITETVMMNDLENRMLILEELRSYGFMVEMDDFGSGYSSLNMLKDMPVDLLKIDMTFLYKSKNQMRAETILRTIVDMTRNLGMLSLTEGVETPEQFSMLSVMGCELFQGYYFAKPMPVEEFDAFCLASR